MDFLSKATDLASYARNAAVQATITSKLQAETDIDTVVTLGGQYAIDAVAAVEARMEPPAPAPSDPEAEAELERRFSAEWSEGKPIVIGQVRSAAPLPQPPWGPRSRARRSRRRAPSDSARSPRRPPPRPRPPCPPRSSPPLQPKRPASSQPLLPGPC